MAALCAVVLRGEFWLGKDFSSPWNHSPTATAFIPDTFDRTTGDSTPDGTGIFGERPLMRSFLQVSLDY
jgi:hypothetical protein